MEKGAECIRLLINDGGPHKCGQAADVLASDTAWSSGSPLSEWGEAEILIFFNGLGVGTEVAIFNDDL